VVAADDGAPEARPPRLNDLVALCRRLNDEGARYVVIGGTKQTIRNKDRMDREFLRSILTLDETP